MTDQTVTTPAPCSHVPPLGGCECSLLDEPTGAPQRETKRADKLEPGDWLAAGIVVDDQPSEVLAALPYETTTDGPSITVVYRDETGKPCTWDLSREATLSLATQDELTAYRDVARRERLAVELRELANLILTCKLPVPQFGMSITASFPTADGVRQVAEALRLEVRSRKPSTGLAAEWPKGRASYAEGLHVSWLTIHDEPAVKPHPSWPTEAELKPWETLAPHGVALASSMEPIAPDSADPTGLLHSRADEADDPTPVSGARVPAHFEDGRTGEVEETGKPLFADGEPKCGAYTPSGPCVLFPGHAELCESAYEPAADGADKLVVPAERPL